MPADLPPPHDLDTVVVYAPRLPPLAGEAAFDAVQIGPEILKITPRLDDALKQSPGLSLFRRTGSEAANPTTQGLSLRSIAGSGAGRALVTLDGAPVNDPFGGWVIWTALPPEGLEGATVVRGAGAGPYGAGALTGVVALQERGAVDGLSSLDLSAGERGYYRAAAAGGAPGLLVTASAETSDGYTPVRGSRQGLADQPLTLQDESFSARVQHDFDGVQAAVRIGGYDERRGAGLIGARSIASGASATATLARPATDGSGGWRVQAWVRGSDLANSSAAVAANRSGTTPASDEYHTPAIGYGLNAALQGKLGLVAWEAGVDGRFADGVEWERFRYMNGGYTRVREAGGKTSVVGAYLDASAGQGPWLLTGGIRVDRWSNTDAIRREFDTATGLPTLDQSTPDAHGTTPTARAGVRYTVSDALWLRAAAYAGFRPPTLNELHRPFRVGNDVTEANPDLKPETLQGVEAGLGGEGPVRWSGTVFYNRIGDPITNVTVGIGPGTFPTAGFIPAGGTLRQRQNAGEINAYGLELETSGDITAALQWRAALSATHARVDGGSSAPQLTGLRPANTPQVTATGGFDWRPLEKLTLTADVRYESARFDDDQNTRRLRPGVEVDARAGWKVGRNSEVYLAAENLADADLVVAQTADGTNSYSAPRTLRVGFAYRR